MASWIIKCKNQMEYKKVKLALSAQYILSKTKMEEDEDGIKKIKYIKVSKNVVPFSDIIFFLLDKDGIDFTLYEKEKGCKAEKVTQDSCKEMEL